MPDSSSSDYVASFSDPEAEVQRQNCGRSIPRPFSFHLPATSPCSSTSSFPRTAGSPLTRSGGNLLAAKSEGYASTTTVAWIVNNESLPAQRSPGPLTTTSSVGHSHLSGSTLTSNLVHRRSRGPHRSAKQARDQVTSSPLGAACLTGSGDDDPAERNSQADTVASSIDDCRRQRIVES
ncbi:hypothetical protein RhiJN_24244 [Ceratobasidium sp. AG-Ba]|nr:hypothetical protein RhiJN_24244 [Ceratobasidium sp. AG-Ba]